MAIDMITKLLKNKFILIILIIILIIITTLLVFWGMYRMKKIGIPRRCNYIEYDAAYCYMPIYLEYWQHPEWPSEKYYYKK